MLHGRFGDTTTTPFIEASVHFPRLNVRGYISFLADTGASGTVLMPPDSKKLGVNFNLLENPVTSTTVGGPAKGFMEEAVVAFLDKDKNIIYAYEIKVQIFKRTRGNTTLPSLLGRDILNRWRVVIDHSTNFFACTPRSWDFQINAAIR